VTKSTFFIKIYINLYYKYFKQYLINTLPQIHYFQDYKHIMLDFYHFRAHYCVKIIKKVSKTIKNITNSTKLIQKIE